MSGRVIYKLLLAGLVVATALTVGMGLQLTGLSFDPPASAQEDRLEEEDNGGPPSPQTAPSAPEQEDGPVAEDRPQRPMLESGGPQEGPVPTIPDGGCTEEYPVEKNNGCHIR